VDVESLSAAALECLPVFPLPKAVLFPGTVLPLHVFEARYCQMVADALAGEKAIAVVLLKPGPRGVDDAMSSSAEIHDVACAGRIIHADKLENGRYNILLQGVARVRLVNELSLLGGYRRFKSEIIERPNDRQLAAASRELARLQSCVLSLRTSVQKSDAQLVEVLRSTSDPVQLADILAAAVISDSEVQQYLLAQPDFAVRLRTLIDGLAEVMVKTGEPPKEARMN
jgi:uncharacterized protein